MTDIVRGSDDNTNMTTTPTTAPDSSAFEFSNRWPSWVCALAGLSASLFYIGLHVRFAAVFGASPLVETTAVCGALGGVGIGALAARRLAGGRPIVVIAVLQGVFAALAVALPWALAGLTAIDRMLLGSVAETPASDWPQGLMQCAIGLVLYALPSMLATASLLVALDVDTRGLRRDDDAPAGRALGLAGIGAAAGALLGEFALAPLAGFAATSWLAMAISSAAAGMLISVDRRSSRPAPGSIAPAHSRNRAIPTTVTASGQLRVSRVSRRHRASKSSAPRNAGRIGTWCLYGTAAVAGTAGLAGQYLWLRVIVHADAAQPGATLILLTAAFAGLGVGALAGRRLAATRLSLGATIASLGLLASVTTLLLYLQIVVALNSAESMAWLALIKPVIYALPLGFLGAVVSLLSELGNTDAQTMPRTTAVTLALAAVGGAGGGTIAWLWVLPGGGFAAFVTLVVAAHLAIALLAWPVLTARARLTTAIGAAAVVAAVATISLGSPTVAAVNVNNDAIAVARPFERFAEIGRTHTVRIVEHQGLFIVQADGMTRASVPVRGSPPTRNARKWLATLPVTARPNAQSLLALGLAGAVMLEGVPSSIEHVDVIEPEDAIVAANRAIADERVIDPLQRAQIRIVANDPRRALHRSSERYDIIVSPHALGRGPIGPSPLSREHLTVLRDHLVDGGVVAHMLEGVTVSDPLVRSAAATLRGEFEHIRLYEPEPGALIFLASTAPLEPELQLARSGAPITSEIMHYSSMGMNGVEDLLAALVADNTGIDALVEGIAAHSDYEWGGFRDDRQTNAGAVTASIDAADPLRRRDSWVYRSLDDVANFGYLTRRLVTQGQQARAIAASEAHPDESTRLTMVGLLHQSRGQSEQAIAAFRSALDRRPDNVSARFLLIQPNIGAIAQNLASQDVLALTQGLPDSAIAVLAARRASSAGNWAAVAVFDDDLGAASVTDPWYPGAVLLRADWRSRAEQEVEQLAFDALRLIDRVLLIDSDRNFYLLRASISIGIGNGDIAVESSRNIVRMTAQIIRNATAAGGQIELQQIEMMRQNLDVITENLRGDFVAANRRRAEEVRQAASLILRFLETALTEEPQ